MQQSLFKYSSEAGPVTSTICQWESILTHSNSVMCHFKCESR